MTANGWIQLAVYMVVLVIAAVPLGRFMAWIYRHEPGRLDRALGRLCGYRAEAEMTWREYAAAALVFNMVGLLAVYGLQRLQYYLPLNPQGLSGVSPDSSLNTAVSFATNTNWQGYVGETTMSYLTQMLALTVQNFVSAATGMAVLVALCRGFVRRQSSTIGNFWVDLSRSTLYVLMPLSLILALALVSQGVIQNLRPYETVKVVDPVGDVSEQTLAMGPAASQIAIKQLGTNGGGFFNVNSAHPFENATPLSNFLEVLAILLIAAACCFAFGRLVNDNRQGWAVLAAMLVIFVPLLGMCAWAESAGNPLYAEVGVDSSPGNMEGKEVRYGVANSALWATATTAASNGSVNSMHDSYTPLGGLVPMWLMQLGEVIFGGVGSGLYGKKIGAFEMKMASVVILVPPLIVLVGTAIAVAGPGLASRANPGTHGFSEILYAFSSAGNNNGSAFAGIGANVPFYNVALAVAMFASRYLLMVPVLAIAGSLAKKKAVPVTSGTLPTHNVLFVVLLAGTVVLVGALTFIPALALGPIVEHLQMTAR
jgi:K+-transporting ATPase ATPase A chain